MSAALPAHTPAQVRAALAEAKGRLEALYGDRLARVVLYGSYARGDARPDSDVDLLVVLRGPYNAYREIRRTGLLRLEVELAHGVDLSLQPYSEGEVVTRTDPFIQNVTRDGVVV
jgi:predicted nucleotidyltransferase